MMNFDAILKYQDEDEKYIALQRKIVSTDENKKFIAAKKAVQDSAANLKKAEIKANEIKEAYKKLEEDILKLSTELAEIEQIDDNVVDIDEVSYYEKAFNSISDRTDEIRKKTEQLYDTLEKLRRYIENEKKNYQSFNVALNSAKAAFNEVLKSHASEVDGFKKRLNTLEAEVNDAEAMKMYNALKTAKKLPAFVEFVPGTTVCCRCGMEIESGVKAKLKNSGDVAECSSCGRKLFVR